MALSSGLDKYLVLSSVSSSLEVDLTARFELYLKEKNEFLLEYSKNLISRFELDTALSLLDCNLSCDLLVLQLRSKFASSGRQQYFGF